jgi:threonine dehydratase
LAEAPLGNSLETAIYIAVRRADLALRPRVRETPLLLSSYLDGVHYKMENLQTTGSFKLRGALNKILSLDPKDRSSGVVTASTGNHGAGVSFAAASLRIPCRVFVPKSASEAKLIRIRSKGAEIVEVEGDPIKAEEAARAAADSDGWAYVSPYNDADVIAGQATVGLELLRQVHPKPEAVFVPVGGGGLISGVATVLKRAWPDVRMIGCSPLNSCVMARSVEAGHVVEIQSSPTISDGTAGGIERDSITLELCSRLVDEFVLLTEDEIADAFRQTIQREALLIEGAAAVALAGYKKIESTIKGTAVVVLTGANVSRQTLLEVLSDA